MRRVAICIGLLLAALVAAPASAAVNSAGGFKYVQKRVQVPDDATRSITAKCPRGTKVLSGGQETIAFGVDVLDFPADTRDRGKTPDDGWTTRISTFGGPATVHVEATCADLKPTYRQDTVRLDNEDITLVTPDCRAGETAIDLGTRVPASNTALSINSGAATGGSTYTAWYDNLSTADAFVDTTLVCLERRAESGFRSNTFDSEQDTFSAECPAGTFAVGGGQTNGGGRDEVKQIGSSTSNARGYVVTVERSSFADDPEYVLNTFALCMKKLRRR